MSSFLNNFLKLDENIRKSSDIALIWEGNYWDDQNVHDCCDIDWKTLNFMIEKVAIVFKNYFLEEKQNIEENQERKILIYLPKIIQLPICILAAIRVGITPVILDPLSSNQNVLQKFPLIVTCDYVWQAQKLIEIKKKVEDFGQILVIRHVAPNYGIPAPRKQIIAKRPTYFLTCENPGNPEKIRIKFDLRNGKDDKWSKKMEEVSDSEVETGLKLSGNFSNSEKNTAILISDGEILEKIEISELLALLEKKKEEIMNSVENIFVLDFPKNLDSFANFLLPWYIGKTMTLFEGCVNYPDSSRISQIIQKHSVNCIISTQELQILHPNYLKFFDFSNLKQLIGDNEILKDAYKL
ncbi:unnamed protein product [Caenorhabditis angaria]|uniref:AMP-dependent synthetase/ligase domain-containing protein n=1 Tax=Caenorhabditis angaria TaxID=860376 RepID=A0A9P1IJ13_9PELO|nr:unnamed protein product [Caenorhabditis angaria]